jgi:hypothetical protein
MEEPSLWVSRNGQHLIASARFEYKPPQKAFLAIWQELLDADQQ